MPLQLSQPSFGLLGQNLPAAKPAPIGPAILAGQAAANASNASQASTAATQQANAIQRLQTIQNLSASVAFADAKDQPAAYMNALKTAKSSGMDTSAMPQQWGSDAQSFVQSAYYSSGAALERTKAQAQIQMNSSTVAKNQSDVNTAAFNTGQPMPFSSPGSNTPNVNAMPGTAGGITTAAPIGGGTPAPASGTVQAGAVQPAGTPAPVQSGPPTIKGITPTPQSGPATIQEQKDQAKTWTDFKATVGDADKSYVQNKATLDQLDTAVNDQAGLSVGGLDVSGAPGVNEVYGHLAPGQQLDILGSQLKLNNIAALSQAGISRMDIPIVKAVGDLAPSSDKYASNNRLEVNRATVITEVGHALNQAIPAFEGAGVKDQNQVVDAVNKAVNSSGAISKDGKIDQSKFNNWPQYLPDNVKTQYFKQLYTDKGVQAFQDKQGNVFSSDQIQAVAKQKGVDPNTLLADPKYGFKTFAPSGQVQQTNPQTQAAAGQPGQLAMGEGAITVQHEGGAGNWGRSNSDNQGMSYGPYQLNSSGALKGYMDSAPPVVKQALAGKPVNSPAFRQAWSDLASNPQTAPAMAQSQKDYIVQNKLNPAMDVASKTGKFDVSQPVVKEALLSAAVQHGQVNRVIQAAASKLPPGASVQQQLQALYQARNSYVQNLSSLNPQEKQSQTARYSSEFRQLVSAMNPVGTANAGQ